MDYSELSEYEINCLVAQRCDGWVPDENHNGILYKLVEHGRLNELRAYSTDFNEALRVLRAWSESDGWGDSMDAMGTQLADKFDMERFGLMLFLTRVTPRDICEAMLAAVEGRE